MTERCEQASSAGMAPTTTQAAEIATSVTKKKRKKTTGEGLQSRQKFITLRKKGHGQNIWP
jgi:hypothetical protein